MRRFTLAGCAAAALLLSACAEPAPRLPLTLPLPDGPAAEIRPGDGFRYLVSLQDMEQAQGGVLLRVTRASAPEMDYSDGLAAKKAAEAYCAGFNRHLARTAYGRFSSPASWMFEGGCT